MGSSRKYREISTLYFTVKLNEGIILLTSRNWTNEKRASSSERNSLSLQKFEEVQRKLNFLLKRNMTITNLSLDQSAATISLRCAITNAEADIFPFLFTTGQ